MSQEQESRDGKGSVVLHNDGYVTSIDYGTPDGDSTAKVTIRKEGNVIEITNVELIKPPVIPFSVPEQKPIRLIDKPDIPEPDMTINAGDFAPVIPQIISKFMFQDWKTTAIGALCGMGYGILDYFQSGQTITWKGVIGAGLLAAWGYFSGDKKK